MAAKSFITVSGWSNKPNLELQFEANPEFKVALRSKVPAKFRKNGDKYIDTRVERTIHNVYVHKMYWRRIKPLLAKHFRVVYITLDNKVWDGITGKLIEGKVYRMPESEEEKDARKYKIYKGPRIQGRRW